MSVESKPSVVFESSVRGMERKLVNPTVSLVSSVLDEAGLLQDGVWTLKDARRIRKKGRERFCVIRVESRSGQKSVRLWCKPRGNDTCFEYSLVPPPNLTPEDVFLVLKRVSPITLRIAESPRLPMAVFERIVDAPPLPGPENFVECVEVEEPKEVAVSEPKQIVVEGSWDEAKEARAMCGSTLGSIDPSSMLSDQEVMDRALMAISFVAEDGFAKRKEASDSIIKHMGIKQFAEGASEIYNTVEGAMRALLMALCRRGKYVERVRCEPRGRGQSKACRGYRITSKGERRLEAIKDGFGAAAVALMRPDWRRAAVGQVAREATAPQASSAVVPDGMSRIREMIAKYEDAQSQLKELDSVISATEADLKTMGLEVEALDLLEKEKRKHLAGLQAEIESVAKKRRETEAKIAQKEQELKQWLEDRRPYESEAAKIEGDFGLRGGAKA